MTALNMSGVDPVLKTRPVEGRGRYEYDHREQPKREQLVTWGPCIINYDDAAMEQYYYY